MKSFISKLKHALLDTIFLSYCYICKKEGVSLCDFCLDSIKKPIDTPYPYITSLYSFKDVRIKKIIHAIKYFHRKDLLVPIACALANIIQDKQSYTKNTYIILPIPMPLLRRYIRGYNHAEALAYELVKRLLSRKLEETTPDYLVNSTILTRKISKKRQVLTTSRRERLLNQQGTFRVCGDVHDMHIILLDDVTTTGATLAEARRMLLSHGAQSIVAYTIAH